MYLPARKKRHSKFRYITLGFGILFIFAALFIIIINNIGNPKKIKQQLSTTHPIFRQYQQTIHELTEHLQENDNNADSSSMQRQGQKASRLATQADTTKATLTNLIRQIEVKQLDRYRTHLTKYLDQTQELINLEHENANIYQQYSQIFAQYEEIILVLKNATNYIDSNPDRYIAEMTNAIAREQQLVAQMKSIQSIPQTQEMIEYSPKILEAEIEFIQKMIIAVQNQDNNAITATKNEYNRKQAEMNKDINRIEDQFNEQIEQLKHQSQLLETQIQNVYNRLAIQYRL